MFDGIITLYGLCKWAKDNNKNLFENMIMPEGIDVSVLTENIMLKSVGLEVLYPDFDFFQDAIGVWSNAKASTFSGWLSALTAEYNPIENYDRSETWTDSGTGTSHSSNSGTQTDKVSAYDSNVFQNRGQTTGSGENDENVTSNTSHTGRIHGNIGITSSMDLVNQELALRVKNIYDMIANDFISEFLILVY